MEELAKRAKGTASGRRAQQAMGWMRRVWRLTATGMAVILALLIGWHVVNGRNGLNVWRQKRAEERQLRQQIDDLNQENSRLRDRISRLKSDPDTIGQVAREQLHYARPNEVIVTLPAPPQAPPAAQGK
ncbi:MAG: FtsB family cell division protein [Terracidiphilus sp.]